MNKKIKVIDLLMEISKGNVKHCTKFNVLYKNNLKRKVYYDANEPNAFACIKNVFDDLPMYDEVRFDEEVEILEDEEDNDISCLNAFKLMEAPYMAKCLDKNSHEEFMEHLKQSEVEIVHKIRELIEKVNKLDKKINKED